MPGEKKDSGPSPTLGSALRGDSTGEDRTALCCVCVCVCVLGGLLVQTEVFRPGCQLGPSREEELQENPHNEPAQHRGKPPSALQATLPTVIPLDLNDQYRPAPTPFNGQCNLRGPWTSPIPANINYRSCTNESTLDCVGAEEE